MMRSISRSVAIARNPLPDYLISQGVPAGSINLSGVGSAQPIASGSLSYNETIAEVWFRDVETAEKAGFARWDSGKSQRGEN